MRIAVTGAKESNVKFKKDDSNEWKYLYYESDSKKKEMWNTLFRIANSYKQVQHILNLIKRDRERIKQPAGDDPFTNLCKNGKCDCCSKSQGKCDCKTSGCCSSCLCCYHDDATKDKCCDAGTACKWDEFKKIQKTFQYHLHNLETSSHNFYLQPVSIHIKLPETNFSDLETEISSSQSNESTTSHKPFLASMVYGFVDYSYKPIKYSKDVQPSQQLDQYKSLDDNKNYWFFNIPQRFTFSYKTTGKPATSSTKSTENKKNDIEAILKEVDDSQKIADKIKSTSSSKEIKQCCEDSDGLDCALSRNYVYLKSEDDKDTKITSSTMDELIKNAKDCCSSGADS